MNLEKLRKSAEELDNLLSKYSGIDAQAIKLASALEELISKSKEKIISDPVEYASVPGDYFFTEGSLGQYVELENAYAKFKLEVTGGETKETKELLDMIKGIQEDK